MKLAREETRIMVTGRNFYRKNNLKFKGRNRKLNRSRNREKKKKNWDPEPEPEPRQNGMVPQHCFASTVYLPQSAPGMLKSPKNTEFVSAI
jgi:hypothetical protein